MTQILGPSVVLGGRYRLVERIAVGGQGEVWRADDTALGRPVALKVLRGEYADNAEFRDRFRREAQHAAALAHPGVAQVFDYDEGGDDTPPYLVMEYVEGEPLSTTIAREAPMEPRRVLQVLASAASALAVAHAAGVVHRDVKPGNLLVTRDGSIKITDFGIARAVDAIPLTRTGLLLGTPQYLAPEQAEGRPATAATDLYALGIIAFEMLTGRRPFEGPATAVLVAHRDAPLPPLPPSVPPAVRDLVISLTAKDPAKRPPGAAALAESATRLIADPAMTVAGLTRLDAAPAGPPAGAGTADGGTQVLAVPPAARVWRGGREHRLVALAGGGLAIALVAGGVGWFARSAPSGSAPTPAPTPSGPAVSRPAPTPSQRTTPTPVVRRAPVRHKAPAPRPTLRHGKGNKHHHK